MYKVLLVDDEVDCVRMLEISLKDEGFEVETAIDGEDAIRKGLRFKPDVLVSDWKLRQVIDGIEVAKTLQDASANLKVILFSGSPSDELQAQAKCIDLFDALEKPLGIPEVIETVRRAAAA